MSTIRFRSCCGLTGFLCLLNFSVFCLGQNVAPNTCLKYEPTLVRLKGVLVRKSYPGPPNYQDITKGDQSETFWLLNLVQPICVNTDNHDPELNPARKNVRSIQLVLPNSRYYREHADLVGQKVLAIGTLFGEHTAHHHTAVLLTVSSIKPR